MTDRTAPADPREALARAMHKGMTGAPGLGDQPALWHAAAKTAMEALNDAGYFLAARQDEPSPDAATWKFAEVLRTEAPPTNKPWWLMDGDDWDAYASRVRMRLGITRQDEPSPALRAVAIYAARLLAERDSGDLYGRTVDLLQAALNGDKDAIEAALAANPPQTREAEGAAPDYIPDAMAMGDCRTCGHDRDNARHSIWASDAHEYAARTPEAQRDE